MGANQVNIDQAIEKFDKGHSRKFSASDVRRIKAAVAKLGLVNFEIKFRDEGRLYIHDPADIVHIHGTMIVSQRSFPGSRDRGAKPYPKWPHFEGLDRWVEKKG